MFKIALPNPSEFEYDFKSYFAQMKIAIKAAEKSYEQLTKNLTEEQLKDYLYITYRFPKIDLYSREQDNEGNVKVHVDEESDEMQSIELEIDTQ
jgi:hypothetical protein